MHQQLIEFVLINQSLLEERIEFFQLMHFMFLTIETYAHASLKIPFVPIAWKEGIFFLNKYVQHFHEIEKYISAPFFKRTHRIWNSNVDQLENCIVKMMQALVVSAIL